MKYRQKLGVIVAAFLFVASMCFGVYSSVAAAASVTITSPSNGESLGTAFTVEGTATASSTVQVYVDDTLEATTTSDGSGNWSVTIADQTTGAKTIEARTSLTPLVYVGTYGGSTMRVFDSSDNTQIAGSPFSIGKSLGYSDVAPDGSELYSTNPLGNQELYVINTDTNTIATYTFATSTQHGQPVVSPDGTRLYITDTGESNIHVVDTNTFSVIDEIAVPASTNGIAISPDGEKLFSGSTATNDLFSIDIATKAVTSIDMGTAGTVLGVVANNAGTRVYAVQNTTPGRLKVIDPSNNTVIDDVVLGDSSLAINILPDDSKVYVSNIGSSPGTISVVDAATNTVDTTINVGDYPYSLDATPNGESLYVIAIGNIFGAGENGGVWEIDTSTNVANEFFETDDGSIAPVLFGDFIVQQTATTSIDVSIVASSGGDSDDSNDESLADTGLWEVAYTTASLLLISSGLLLRKYKMRSL